MRGKKTQWYFLPVLLIMLLSFATVGFAKKAKPSNPSVAVVNGSAITQRDLDKEVSRIQRRFLSMGKKMDASQFSKVKESALDSLIGRELLYQESQQKGIKVGKEAVSKELASLKKRFSNEKDYNSALKRMNLTEKQLKGQIKKGMAIQQLIDKEIVQKVTVSDKEVKQYYDAHPSFFKQPERIRASHILIKVDSKADKSKKEAALRKIKDIQKQVKKGGDFAALAKKYSEGPSGARGGDLGYFSRGQMVKPFENAAFALKPGQVSDVVETQFGYHLIKLVDKKPEGTVAYKDVKDKLRQYLKSEKVQKGITDHVENLKKHAKIKKFVSDATHKK